MDKKLPTANQEKSIHDLYSENPNLVTIQKAAQVLGVSKDTLRRWEAKGKITSIRTATGYRLYDIKKLTKKTKNTRPAAVTTSTPEPLFTQTALPSQSSDQTSEEDIPFAEETTYIAPSIETDADHSFYSKHIELPPINLSTPTLQAEEGSFSWPAVESVKISTDDQTFSQYTTEKQISRLSVLTSKMLNRKVYTSISVVFTIFIFLIAYSLYLPGFKNTGTGSLIAGFFTNQGSTPIIEPTPEIAKASSIHDVLAVSSIATASKYLELNLDTNITGNLAVEGEGVFTENITAPNIIYSLVAGNNITISGDPQNPVIAATAFAETDTLQSVTARGATTTIASVFSGGLTTSSLSLTGALNMGQLSDDPASAVNGTTYYNTGSNKFRCYISGSWRDCDTDTDTDTITPASPAFGSIGLSGDTGTPEDLADGDTILIAGSNGLTTTTTSPDTLTISLSLSTSSETVTTSSNSGLELSADGISMLRGCANGQLLKWNEGTKNWECASDTGGLSSAVVDIREGNTPVGTDVTVLNFTASDFTITESPSGQDNFSIDYANSGITRKAQNETIAGNWVFTNGITIGSGQTVTVGTIGLNSAGSDALTSGATQIGVFDEFANSSSTTLQAVLNDLDSAIGSGASKWTDAGTVTYLTATTDDVAIGGTTLAAPFSVDVSLNTVRIGSGSTNNGTVSLYASDGDTGDLLYNTSDQFQFSGGSVLVDSGFTVSAGTVTVPAGSIDNSELANDSVTINTSGPLGGGGVVALGGTLSLTCSTCLTTASTLFTLAGSAGSDSTITSGGTVTIAAGTGISSTGNGSGTITVANTGVTSNVAGTGISVSGATGAVTITNTGVTSLDGGTGSIAVSNASFSTGTLTIDNAAADGSTKGIAAFNATHFSASSGVISIANNGIALGTLTTGNYVATVTGNTQVGVSGSGSETAGVTLSINADSLTAAELNATLSFADADYIDLSAILHDDTALQGLRLPNTGATPSNPVSGEGQIAYDATNNNVIYYNGSSWQTITTTGTAGDITDVLAGAGLTGGGSSGSVTLTIGGSSTITVNADDISVTADSIGDTQLAFNTGQNLTSSSAVTFATVDTGQGANELYDMDQNVLTTSAVTFATLDTGQGANELYDMDQNVLTTSSPTFVGSTFTGLTASSAVYTDASKNLTSTAPTSGAIGYWSRSGTTLTTTTANDIVSLATTNTTGADLGITNTGVYTGTGIVNLTANSATTGNLFNISATGMTTGEVMNIDATWAPADGSTNDGIDLNFTHTPTASADNFTGLNLQVADSTTLANTVYGGFIGVNSTGNAAKTLYGFQSGVQSSSTTADTLISLQAWGSITGALSTGTRSVYGVASPIASTAASTGGTLNITGGRFTPSSTLSNPGTGDTATNNVFGVYTAPVLTIASDCTTNCTSNQYGLYAANGTSSTNGTSTKYGLYVEPQTGADNNYGAYFGSSVGIGDTSPIEGKLSVTSTHTSSTTNYTAGTYNTVTATSLASSASLIGTYNNYVTAHSSNTANTIRGTDFQTSFNSTMGAEATVGVTNMYANYSSNNVGGAAATGTVSNAVNLYLDKTYYEGATGAVATTFTNKYGIYTVNQGTSGAVGSGTFTINNAYGMYLADTTGGTLRNTNLAIGGNGSSGQNYSIYNASAYQNYFAGNVGIGDASPTAALTVGSSDAFQVNSSGAIAAATGITSSGTINFSGLTASSGVYTDGSKNLTSTAPTSGTLGYWSRTGTTLSTANASDNVTVDGTLDANGQFDIGDGGDAGTISATTLDLDATGALQINSSGGAISIGNDAVAQAINVGTGAAARTITVGNTTGATALALNSGTGSQTFSSSVASTSTTSSAFVFTANSLTSGTGAYINSTSLSTGKLFQLSTGAANTLTSGTLGDIRTTSTALTGAAGTGSLLNLDWSPGSATTATGDLFALNIGTNGTTTGSLFNILDSGSSLFSISETALTSALPVNFTSPGDVSIAYDIQFTNPTASYIKSYSALTIQPGDPFGSSNLTFAPYNEGSVYIPSNVATAYGVDVDANLLSTGRAVDISSTSTAGGASGASYLLYLDRSGANASATHTAYGLYSTVANTGTTNVNIGLFSQATGAITNYGIQTGAITSAASGTNYQINAGAIAGAASATSASINTGAISGAGTSSSGITLGANSATATTNYGINVGAISGAGTTNIGLNLGAVSGASNNYALITNGGNVGLGDTSPAALLTVGASDAFQVNSTGAIAAITGYTQASGAFNLTPDGTNDINLTVANASTRYLNIAGLASGTTTSALCIDASNNVITCTAGGTGSGDITAVGSMTSGDAFADSSADDDWLGLGATAGRISFDDLATDEVDILSATLDLNAGLITNIGNSGTDFTTGGGLTLAGDLVAYGNTTLGDASADTINFSGRVSSSIIPATNDLHNLGADTARWTGAFYGTGGAIHLGTSTTDEATISYNTTSNVLNFGTDSTTNGDMAFNTDQMYIDKSTGYVGIGSSTPTSNLFAQATDGNAETTTNLLTLAHSISNAGTGDSYTKLLLHQDGSNASTTFTDSSTTGHTVTAGGNAQLNTSTKKFGTAAGTFDGTGDRITAPDNADFTFGSNDFTIDTWINLNSAPAAGFGAAIYSQDGGAGIFAPLAVYLSTGMHVVLYASSNNSSWDVHGGTDVCDATSALSTGSWHHFALVRSGNNWMVFIDGTQCGTTQVASGTLFDSTSSVYIGGQFQSAAGAGGINGYLDEYRVSNGIARWTSSFTVPAVAYGGTVGSDNIASGILFQMESAGGSLVSSGQIASVMTTTTTDNEVAALTFSTINNSGSAVAPTERMRLTGAGNLGLGDLTPDAKFEVLATTEQMRLTHTDGSKDARFTVDTNGMLTIDTSTDGTAGSVYLTDDLYVGASSETIAAAGFALDGNDAFVSGMFGVEGVIYTDAGLDVNNSAFAINSSGAITAATGITSSGTINFSGLTASSAVYTDGSKNLTSTAPTSGAIGYWSRTGTTLTPTTANDIVSIANTTTSGADLALTNTGVYTGTGIFNLTANSATTGNLLSLTATGMTSGEVLNIDSTYSPADGSNNEAIDINLTNSPTVSANTLRGMDLTINDSTALANTNYGYRTTITLSGNAAKIGRAVEGNITSSSTTADTLNGGYFTSTATGNAARTNNIALTGLASSSSTTADNLIGVQGSTSATGILTAGTRNNYGLVSQPASTAASTGGTNNIYGAYLNPSSTLSNPGATDTATNNVYGASITTVATTAADCTTNCTTNQYGIIINDGTSSTNGTSTKYGLYIAAQTGADTNVGGYFGSNVGINDTTPDAWLDIDAATTTTAAFGLTDTGVHTGTTTSSVAHITANGTTTGTVLHLSATGMTSGTILNTTGTWTPTAGGTVNGVGIAATYNPNTTAGTFRGMTSSITDTSTLASTTSIAGLFFNNSTGDAASKSIYGAQGTAWSSSTTADTTYGLLGSTSITGVITAGTRASYGVMGAPASTAASTGGTMHMYGGYFAPSSTLSNPGVSDTAANNVYGVYTAPSLTVAADCTTNCTSTQYGLYAANGTSSTNGTSTKYGLYIANQTGADNNYHLYVNSVSTATSGVNQNGGFFAYTVNPGSATSATTYYDDIVGSISTSANAIDHTNSVVRGGVFVPTHAGSGTLGSLNGANAALYNTSSGTVTTSQGFSSSLSQNAGTISNYFGYLASVNSNAGTVANTYGYYAGDLTTGTQTNTPWSFYASDTSARNYFAGNTGIGSDNTPDALLELESSDTDGGDFLITNTGIGTSGTVASIVSNATTTGDILTLSATALTSGTALTVTGNATTGMTDSLVKFTGDVGSTSMVRLSPDFSTASGVAYGILLTGTDSLSTGEINYGIFSQPTKSGIISTSVTDREYGLIGQPISTAAHTDGLQELVGVSGIPISSGATTGSTTSIYGANFQTNSVLTTGGTLVAAGIRVRNDVSIDTTGTTTQYGILIDAIANADTNYAIYSGGGSSYFAGNIGIGDLTPTEGTLTVTGTGYFSTDLTVAGGDITGANSESIDIGEAANGTISLLIDGTSGLNVGSTGISSLGNVAHTIVNSGGALAIDSNSTGAINLGTGANAKAITIGNATGATALAFNSGTGSQTFTSQVVSGTTTTSGFVFDATALTTGTGSYFTSDSITQGKLLQIATTGNTLTSGTLADIRTTSTALTGATGTGSLLNLDWTPGSSTTATGDLFALNIGANGTTSGSLFNILDSGSSIFSVKETAFETSLPSNFTAAGDVAIAYDLNFTNPTTSYIKSAAPLSIVAGETFNSSNLTLQTYNQGTIVFDTATTTGTAFSMTNSAMTTGIGLRYDFSGVTSGRALYMTGPTATGVTTGFARIDTAVGNVGQALAVVPTYTLAGGTAYGLYIPSADNTSSANELRNIYSGVTMTGNAAKVGIGIKTAVSSTSTTGDTMYGGEFLADHNTAVTSGNTTLYGIQARALNDGITDTNGATIYGGHFTATGNTGGTSTAYGVYGTASGADNNYPFYSGVAFPTANTAGLCWDNAGESAIYDCNGTPTDLAENYGTTDTSIEAGDVVIMSGQAQQVLDPREGKITTKAFIAKANSSYQPNIIGIVSTNPNQVYGEDGLFSPNENPRPVSLAGRVPVKVSTENGAINDGDYLTSSSIPGVAMKATKPGVSLGRALNSFSGPGVGKVIVYVDTGFADPSDVLANLTIGNDGSLLGSNITADKLTVSGDVTVGGIVSANRYNLDASTLNLTGSLASLPVDSQNRASIADALNILAQAQNTTESRIGDLEAKEASTAAALADAQTLGAQAVEQVASLDDKVASTSASIANLSSQIDALLASIMGDSNPSTPSASPTPSSDLALTPPEIMFASDSATLDTLTVTSEATVSGNLTAYEGIFQDSLKSLGETFLGKTNIAGDLSVDGTFSISEGSKVNALPVLYFQTSALAEAVDFFNGLVTISKDGVLAAKEIVTEQISVKADTSAGQTILSAGETELAVINDLVEDNSIIILTSETTGAPTLAVADKVAGAGFVVKTGTPFAQDIKFSYLVVGQR